MPILWSGLDEGGDASHRTPVTGAVETIQDAIRPGGAEGLRELTGVEAATAFFAEFEHVLARIRRNHQVVHTAQLSHDEDGVLQTPAASSESRSENSREGGR